MSIFKDCDVRGVWGEDLDLTIAYRIGYATAKYATAQAYPGDMLVGGDARTSTPQLKTALIDGLRAGGNAVIDLGMVPTPVFYYALSQHQSSGVMVTASHNPAKFNGFKFMFGQMPVTPADMKALEVRVNTLTDMPPVTPQPSLSSLNINEKYIDAVLQMTPPSPPLKIVVDAGNGATSILAPGILRKLGHQVVELF